MRDEHVALPEVPTVCRRRSIPLAPQAPLPSSARRSGQPLNLLVVATFAVGIGAGAVFALNASRAAPFGAGDMPLGHLAQSCVDNAASRAARQLHFWAALDHGSVNPAREAVLAALAAKAEQRCHAHFKTAAGTGGRSAVPG